MTPNTVRGRRDRVESRKKQRRRSCSCPSRLQVVVLAILASFGAGGSRHDLLGKEKEGARGCALCGQEGEKGGRRGPIACKRWVWLVDLVGNGGEQDERSRKMVCSWVWQPGPHHAMWAARPGQAVPPVLASRFRGQKHDCSVRCVVRLLRCSAGCPVPFQAY